METSGSRLQNLPLRAALVALVVALGNAPSAAAADPSLEQRVRELEETVRELRAERAAPAGAPAPTPASFKVTTGGSEGFSIGSGDGAFNLRLGGYVQADGRFFLDDEERKLSDQFLLRRVRLDIRGTLFRYVDFRFLPDFAGSKLVLQDAYVELRYFPLARLLVGKTKAPFGLERLQSGTELTFPERALPTNLVPNRDIGAQVRGDPWGGALSYAVALLNGVPDLGSSDADVSDDKDFVGRIFAHPLKPTGIAALQGLGLGLAGSIGRRDGSESSPELPAYRSSGQATIFSFVAGDDPGTTAFARGRHERWSPQGYWYFGPFGVLGEYVHSSYGVRLGTATDETGATIPGARGTAEADSWQVTLSWVVTGETASYKGVVPSSPFEPGGGKWGALELAARVAELSIDDEVFDRGFADRTKSIEQASSFGLGANWYLNQALKVSLAYERTGFDGGASSGDRSDEHFLVTRFQLVL